MSSEKPQLPPVMILCGGMGTRLQEVTELLPKPMVKIGEQPIIWHIMRTYAAFGVRRFILCLGYKREAFIDFFVNYHLRVSDATITLGHNPKIDFHDDVAEADWQITLAATGLETKTAGRIARAAKYLKENDEDFFLTYGDGVSDVDIRACWQEHRRHRALATITAVHPAARFGEMQIEDGLVTRFDEKPSKPLGYVNGGFMVLRREFLHQYISAERDEFLESGPLMEAVANRDVRVFQHEGFWQCMDTPREFTLLNQLWNQGRAPWTKFWHQPPRKNE